MLYSNLRRPSSVIIFKSTLSAPRVETDYNYEGNAFHSLSAMCLSSQLLQLLVLLRGLLLNILTSGHAPNETCAVPWIARS